MNQGRIWCVVSPNHGLPLLLGSVAVTSLIVHACVMSHTTWMSTYWQGNAKAKTAEIDTSTPVASAATPFTLSIAPMAGTPGKTETSFVVTVAPNPIAPMATASAEATSPPAETIAVASGLSK